MAVRSPDRMAVTRPSAAVADTLPIRRSASAVAAMRTVGSRPRPRPVSDLPVMGPMAVSVARSVDPPANDNLSSGNGFNGIGHGGSGHNRSTTIQREVGLVDSPSLPATHNGNGNGHGNGDSGTDPSAAPALQTTTSVLDRVDAMMAQLEERILEELERRGGRFTGSF